MGRSVWLSCIWQWGLCLRACVFVHWLLKENVFIVYCYRGFYLKKNLLDISIPFSFLTFIYILVLALYIYHLLSLLFHSFTFLFYYFCILFIMLNMFLVFYSILFFKFLLYCQLFHLHWKKQVATTPVVLNRLNKWMWKCTWFGLRCHYTTVDIRFFCSKRENFERKKICI